MAVFLRRDAELQWATRGNTGAEDAPDRAVPRPVPGVSGAQANRLAVCAIAVVLL
jgi:hypothetical protein